MPPSSSYSHYSAPPCPPSAVTSQASIRLRLLFLFHSLLLLPPLLAVVPVFSNAQQYIPALNERHIVLNNVIFPSSHRSLRSPPFIEGETAPVILLCFQPEVVTPEVSSEEDGRTEISDDFLRRLSAQQLADRRANLHRGKR